MREALLLFLIHSLEETHRGPRREPIRAGPRHAGPPARLHLGSNWHQWQLPSHGSATEGTRLGLTAHSSSRRSKTSKCCNIIRKMHERKGAKPDRAEPGLELGYTGSCECHPGALTRHGSPSSPLPRPPAAWALPCPQHTTFSPVCHLDLRTQSLTARHGYFKGAGGAYHPSTEITTILHSFADEDMQLGFAGWLQVPTPKCGPA